MSSNEIIAIFNSNPDAIEMLTNPLRAAGFSVVSALVHELRNGAVDPEAFLRQHDPRVVIFDVAPPYGRNWRLLERLRELPAAQARHFVITSVNARRVEELVGRDERIYEVVGKPYDIGEVVRAVKESLRQRPTHDADEQVSTASELPERRHDADRRMQIERRHEERRHAS